MSQPSEPGRPARRPVKTVVLLLVGAAVAGLLLAATSTGAASAWVEHPADTPLETPDEAALVSHAGRPVRVAAVTAPSPLAVAVPATPAAPARPERDSARPGPAPHDDRPPGRGPPTP